MKRTVYLALLALSFVGCGKKEQSFDATGTFETTEVTVSAESAGQLEYFNVVEGQEIKSGDIVGNIESLQLQLQRSQLDTQKSQLDANDRQLSSKNSQLDATDGQLQANIRQLGTGQRKVDYSKASAESGKLDLETQLAAIRQQISNQQKELQRFTELYNDGAVAKKQVDDIAYSISVLEKQLAATANQITSSNASIDWQVEGMDMDRAGIAAQIEGVESQRAGVVAQKSDVDAQRGALSAQKDNLDLQQAVIDDQISKTVIKSPLTGMVLEKYVEQGEYMTPGKPMFKIADTRNMIMRAYVTSQQLQNLKVGQHVKVFADYGNNQGKTYDGVVTWISSNAEFTPKTIVTDDERADLVYAVKISVKNDGGIKIGMYGKVKF